MHALAQLGDQLKVLFSQGLNELGGERAPVTEKLSREAFDQAGSRVTIIGVTRCHRNRPELTTVLDHQVKLEAVEPTARGLAASSDLVEDLMAVDPAVMAHHQRGGGDPGDPSRRSLPRLEIDAQGNERGGAHRHQPVITEALREGAGSVPADMEPGGGLEVAARGLMKMDQEGHDFAQHHAAPAAAVTLTVLSLRAVPVGSKPAAEVIDLAEQVF